ATNLAYAPLVQAVTIQHRRIAPTRGPRWTIPPRALPPPAPLSPPSSPASPPSTSSGARPTSASPSPSRPSPPSSLPAAAARSPRPAAIPSPALRRRGAPAPTRLQWRLAGLTGLLLLVGGNGLVTWGQQTVPSGRAALIVATTPLWMVILAWLFYRGER